MKPKGVVCNVSHNNNDNISMITSQLLLHKLGLTNLIPDVFFLLFFITFPLQAAYKSLTSKKFHTIFKQIYVQKMINYVLENALFVTCSISFEKKL